MSVQSSVSDRPSAAFAGLLVGTHHIIVPMKNLEVSAEMAFGLAVCFKASAATDQDALLPAAQTDKVVGVIAHSHVYDRTYTLADGSTAGELGTTGLKPGAMLNCVKRGMMWVTCQSGCAPGDKLYVRAISGTYTVLGGLENAADAAKMIDLTAAGTWMTTASAGGLAIISLDLP